MTFSVDIHFDGTRFDATEQYRFVWPGSHAMAKYLATLPAGHFDQCSVLELGAGTGHLTCFLAQQYCAKRITATEWSEKQLAMLKANISANRSTLKTPFDHVCVQSLDWNDIVSREESGWWNRQSWDLLIGADLVWDEESAQLVAKAVYILLRNNFSSTFLLAFVVRSDFMLSCLKQELERNRLLTSIVFDDKEFSQDASVFRQQRSIIFNIRIK